MSRKSYRGSDERIKKVIARAREIDLVQYRFDLPQQTENDKLIAEHVGWKARSVGAARKHKHREIDQDWFKEVSVPDLCRWAMHPNEDVFADLLEITELTDDGERACFPGVTPDQVEDRKKLIKRVLDRYADYLIDLERKAGTHPLG